MFLHEWLFEQHMPATEFSKLLGISAAHIRHYIRKRQRIGKFLAKEIERVTQGKVTAAEISQYSEKGEP